MGGSTGTGGASASAGGTQASAAGTTGTGGIFSGGANAGGTGAGGMNTGGIVSTGGATSCTPACAGAKSVCDLSTFTCVECLSDTNCTDETNPACKTSNDVDAGGDSGTGTHTGVNTCVPCTQNKHCKDKTSLCDTATNECVECLSAGDCKNAGASACVNGLCEPCSSNNDCALIQGRPVCASTVADSDAGADAGSGTAQCVQCAGMQYAACGQSGGKNLICNSLTNECSTSATEHSAGLCQPCVSDAQCAPGELCAEQVFNGKSVGYFCFFKRGDTANGAPADCTNGGRPYVKAWATTTVDGQSATLCGLAVTTCTALNEFRQTDCASSGAASDPKCGFEPGVDSKCALYGSTQYRCTVVCLSDDDCLSGVTCNTTTNPRTCNLQ